MRQLKSSLITLAVIALPIIATIAGLAPDILN